MKLEPFTVEARGGLCNRLRVVLSYRARWAPLGGLRVIWRPDGEIAGGRWSDVFEPLEGVEFIDHSVERFVGTCDPASDAKPGWQDAYRELRPVAEVLERVERLRAHSLPAGYAAMHVRRTDHVGLARASQLYTPDGDFLAWAPTGTVYLATDNGTTQREMTTALERGGRRVVVAGMIPEHARQNEGGVRNTALAAAAVDLFVCAGAARFKGSGDSSFTNTIELLRCELKGWWST